MRNTVILVFELFLLAALCVSFADTHIPAGNVSGVWSASGSPYYIDGEVHVPTDSMLIIEPGCSIVFTGHYKFCVDSNAVLKAIGTATDSIVFIAQDSAITDSTGGHHGIRFYYSAGGCSLVYCKIKYGNATDGNKLSRTLDDYGGGIYCVHSSPTIANNTICKNSAEYFGGGIYCSYDSNPIISNNVILRNSAYHGGGIECYNSSPTISNNRLSENSVYYFGGGIYCCNASNPIIENNIISGNSSYNGGGISCSENSNPIIERNIIGGNQASYGGGIACWLSSCPIIENNTIIRNSAGDGGGISCCYFSNPTIENNTINSNTASGDGGGISCNGGSNPSIENNIISTNSAGGGGGINCGNSNSIISRNIIAGNSAYWGGGILCSDSTPTISANIITRNSSLFWGGGIYILSCTPTILNNIISENYGGGGGGIFCEQSNLTISNNIIVNDSSGLGGGIYCYKSNIIISNNTIIRNKADVGGGAIYCYGSSLIILNTILWGDSAWDGDEVYLFNGGGYVSPCTLFIAYTDIDSNKCYIESGAIVIWGPGNINADPLFADTLFHLSSSSPCIDAGAESVYVPIWDTVIYAPRYDFEGDTRPHGADWDIGADEYGACEIFEQVRLKPQTYGIFAYPNPFNSSCFIKVPAGAKIEIYDLKGNITKKFGAALANEIIVREQIYDSNQLYIWTPDRSVSSGIYLIRAMVGNRIMTKRIIFIK